jgi:hypothetical protein
MYGGYHHNNKIYGGNITSPPPTTTFQFQGYAPPPPPGYSLPYYTYTGPTMCNDSTFITIFWILMFLILIVILFSSLYVYDRYVASKNTIPPPPLPTHLKNKKNVEHYQTFSDPIYNVDSFTDFAKLYEQQQQIRNEKIDFENKRNALYPPYVQPLQDYCNFNISPKNLLQTLAYLWEKEEVDTSIPIESDWHKNNWKIKGLLVNEKDDELIFLLLQNRRSSRYMIYNQNVDMAVAVLDATYRECPFLKNGQRILLGGRLLDYGFFVVVTV